MVVGSSTQSPSSWLPPENWLCRSMMRRGRWAQRVHTEPSDTTIYFFFPQIIECVPWSLIVPLSSYILVCLSLTCTSLCGLWWRWHWPADPGLGARLSPAGGHTWTSGWYDGERQDWSGLLQVSIAQELIFGSNIHWTLNMECFFFFQLLGPRRGWPHVGHGVWATDQTHCGAGHNATERHPPDYDVQCHLPQRDSGSLQVQIMLCTVIHDCVLMFTLLCLDPRSWLPWGLHFPGSGACGFHFRKHHTEGSLGRGDGQEVLPSWSA